MNSYKERLDTLLNDPHSFMPGNRNDSFILLVLIARDIAREKNKALYEKSLVPASEVERTIYSEAMNIIDEHYPDIDKRLEGYDDIHLPYPSFPYDKDRPWTIKLMRCCYWAAMTRRVKV